MKKSLKEKIQKLKSIQLAKTYLVELHKKEKEYLERKKELEVKLKKELTIIERLDADSILSRYLHWVGNGKEKLELSKEYYFELSMEYNEIVELLDKIEFEKRILAGKNVSINTLKSEIKAEILEGKENVNTPNLKELSRLIKNISKKIELATEIKEAIDSGVEANKRFNQIIKYIENTYPEINSKRKKNQLRFDFDVRKIKAYQSHLMNLRHSMLRYEAEVNDIYKEMFKDSNRSFTSADNFFKLHRSQLFKDLRRDKQLKKCYHHLKGHKETILNFNRTLRSDLKKLNKTIKKLEEKETELLNQITI